MCVCVWVVHRYKTNKKKCRCSFIYRKKLFTIFLDEENSAKTCESSLKVTTKQRKSGNIKVYIEHN